MKSNMRSTIVVVGPTASGKTNFSIKLAEKLGGEIINADSMQVYDGFNILKAAPTKEDMRGISHHLFGIVDLSKKFSVADWLKLVEEKISDIHYRNKTPILVGGSGMYINASLEGISNIPKINKKIRDKVDILLKKRGLTFFYDQLRLFEDQQNFKIKKNDRQRLIRAYEVLLQTGKTISWWQNKQIKNPIVKKPFKILLSPPKDILYPKINSRLEKMIDIGLIEEIKKYHSKNLSLELPSMKAIGINYFFEYLDRTISIDEAIKLTQQESRKYAKRQMTWFRNSFSSDITYSNLFKNDKKFILNVVKAFNLL